MDSRQPKVLITFILSFYPGTLAPSVPWDEFAENAAFLGFALYSYQVHSALGFKSDVAAGHALEMRLMAAA